MMRPTSLMTFGDSGGSGFGRRARRAADRGVTIILVVVVLVLMVVIGAAYLQVAMVQRQGVEPPVGDMDAVKSAIIAQIAGILQDDLIDENGNFFNPLPGANNTGYDEPYDYPWVNPDQVNAGNQINVRSPLNGPIGTAYGGMNDDIWLASTEPTYDPAEPGFVVWPQITNIGGVFLELPDSNNAPAGTWPNEFVLAQPTPATPANANLRSIGLNLQDDLDDKAFANFLPHGVDADGDGIRDSRRTWAPLPVVNGVAYTMAVRIVDLGAMANANVWLSQVDSAGDYDTITNDAPRWWFPSELDLGGFVFDTATNIEALNTATFLLPSAAMTELDALIDTRFGDTGGSYLPTSWANSPRGRFDFWRDGAALYYNPQTPYDTGNLHSNTADTENEIELRWRNGLNRSAILSKIEDPSLGMNVFLRGGLDDLNYESALLNMGFTIPVAPKDVDNNEVRYFFENEPRHQMTTASGAAIFAPKLSGESGRVLKKNINRLILSGDNLVPPYEGLPAESSLVNELFRVFNAGGTYVIPASLSSNPVRPISTIDNFSRQYAVSIVDYADGNNVLTEIDLTPAAPNSGDEFYGLETALPFITEVYVQGLYEVTNVVVVTPPAPPVLGDYDLTWTLQGQAGYAIEIRNPLKRNVDLRTVELWIDGVRVDDGVAVDFYLSDIAGSGFDFLGPNDVLILWRKSDQDSSTEALDDITTDITTPPPLPALPRVTEDGPPWNYIYKEMTGGGGASDGPDFNWPQRTNGVGNPIQFDTITVELRPSIKQGTNAPIPALWAYAKVDTLAPPDEYMQSLPLAAPPTVGTGDYLQRGRIGNANGINMLTIDAGEFANTIKNPDSSAPIPELSSSSVAVLGKEIKTAGPLDVFVLTQDQIIVSDRGGFAHIGELAHLAIVGPSPTTTIAQAWNDESNPTSYMLNAPQTIDPSPGQLFITHAEFLLERFVTHSPRTDTENNDNYAGSDDDLETLIPGMINLNTMPEHLLAKVLPITDATLRAEVAARIAIRRDEVENRGGVAVADPRPGIAYVSELYNDLNVASPGLKDLLTTGGFAGDTSTIPHAGGAQVDFLNNPIASGDLVADDREEEMMLIKWLNQVASGRSDRFVAYVLIEGWKADEFTDGGNGPVQALRFIAVFDRSTVIDETSSVRILAVQDVN